MNEYLKKIPVIRPLAKAGYHLALRMSDWYVLQRLSHISYSPGRQLAGVFKQLKQPLPQDERDFIAKIEQQRQLLSQRQPPLVDGSLGPGGLYDENVSIQAACGVSKPPRPLLLMYLLLREFKPLNVIELGTNLGISSAYLAAALKFNAQGGKLTTLEASPYRLRLAREVHQKLALENIIYVEGLFSQTLPNTLSQTNPVDCSFIDGHHQYQPTLDYFQMIGEHSTNNALLLFDDIRWSDGMKRAWSEIQTAAEVSCAVDLSSMGICLYCRDPLPRRYIFPPLHYVLS